MRTLATIQKIKTVLPHTNSDNLEIAQVLGWNVVVKKGEFQPGDWCVYCEIDSLLPAHKHFEFLANKHYRIRTIRLRGEVSQGICFPVSILEDFGGAPLNEGADVTELLGIEKYEPPVHASLGGDVKGNFPSFLMKTDETRIQTLERFINMLLESNDECYFAEKLDGASMTVYKYQGDFGVCSRNLELKQTDANSLWQVALREKMDINLPNGVCLQGELVGPNIQDNKYKLKQHEFYVFNVFDIQKGTYYNLKEAQELVQQMNLKFVPVMFTGRLKDFGNDYHEVTRKLIDLATRQSTLHPVHMEGYVIRTLTEMTFPGIGRGSFKVINPNFLLKFE